MDRTDFYLKNRLVQPLTYNDFRENPYCYEGYTTRDVPEAGRISKLRYDPFDVVYHRTVFSWLGRRER